MCMTNDKIIIDYIQRTFHFPNKNLKLQRRTLLLSISQVTKQKPTTTDGWGVRTVFPPPWVLLISRQASLLASLHIHRTTFDRPKGKKNKNKNSTQRLFIQILICTLVNKSFISQKSVGFAIAALLIPLAIWGLCLWLYAKVEMLQFPWHLNPSILTGAGVGPKFALTEAPFFRVVDGAPDIGETGLLLSFPNCSSWMTGFEALLGGEPIKNGGDEATWKFDLSEPQLPWSYVKTLLLWNDSRDLWSSRRLL